MLRSRTILIASLLTGTAITAVPAYAQAQPETARPAARAGQGPNAAVAGDDTIIVTARRRAENVQDVPISIAVSSGRDLERASVTTFIDVQRQAPSLRINPSALSGTTLNLSMRGQALVDIRLNIDPAVAIYQDGVYLPRAQGSNAADLLDIARVEVLAGPQGTLYGKNTTGGAVSIYTNVASTAGFEGFIRGRYAEYGEANLSGMVNLPIGTTAALRLVGSFTDRSGYGTDLIRGGDVGSLNSRLVRGSFLWEPSQALTITLRGDYTKANLVRDAYDGPMVGSFRPIDPNTGAAPSVLTEAALELNNFTGAAAFAAQPLATRLAQLRAAQAYLEGFTSGDPDDFTGNQASVEDVNVWGISGTIDYNFSEAVSLKSVTAYRGFLRTGTQDLDGTPLGLLEYPYQRTRDRQFSQEVQLNLTGLNDRLNAVFGGFYSDETGHERIDQIGLRVLTAAVGATSAEADIKNESLGVFGQGTFHFTDAFSATVGLRWSRDNRSLISYNHNNLNCTALGVSIASLGGLAGCRRPMTFDDSALSYTASLEYRPAHDLMFYAKTSRGYRVGGLQEAASGNTPAQANVAFNPFNSETVTDYELGMRSEWFDRRLRFNITYYHSILNDAIRNVSTPVPGGGVASGTQNAAKALIDGVEFDIRALPVRGLELSLNGAWTDARFQRYITPTGEDRTNLPLLLTPRWQIGAAIAYTAELGVGNWRNQVDLNYSSRQLSAEGTPAEIGAFAPERTIIGARSSLDVTAWNATIALYVKNLTNERPLVYPIDLRSALGFIYSGPHMPPRQIGIELTKRF